MTFGDVGGINEFLKLFIGFFIGGVSSIAKISLLTKYLYRYNSGQEERQVKVPNNLEGTYILSKVFVCC